MIEKFLKKKCMIDISAWLDDRKVKNSKAGMTCSIVIDKKICAIVLTWANPTVLNVLRTGSETKPVRSLVHGLIDSTVVKLLSNGIINKYIKKMFENINIVLS
jgi:hypothetical protein